MSELPRLSRTERRILEALARQPDSFGLQLVERSGGAIKRGTVYVTLGRMEAKGYLDSRQEERAPSAIGLPRRLYRVSAFGQRVLAAWRLADGSFASTAPQVAS